MIFNDFFANGKPNAGPGIFRIGFEPLEQHKNALGIFLFETDSIIRNYNLEISAIGNRQINIIIFFSDFFSENADFRASVFPAVFDGIADQIDEKLLQLERNSLNRW